MADKKEKKEECPRLRRWPLGVGAAIVVFLLGGFSATKSASTPQSRSADRPGILQKVPVYADRWTEIPTNPQTESGSLDFRGTGGIKFLVASNNDIAHPDIMSETSSRGIGDGKTNVLVRIALSQGVAYTEVKFRRNPK